MAKQYMTRLIEIGRERGFERAVGRDVPLMGRSDQIWAEPHRPMLTGKIYQRKVRGKLPRFLPDLTCKLSMIARGKRKTKP